MAEVTVTEYFDTGDPNIEMVIVEASDGETYKCRKIGKIIGALATHNFADGEFTNEKVSLDDANFVTGTIGIELLGTDTTDVPLTLMIFGNR